MPRRDRVIRFLFVTHAASAHLKTSFSRTIPEGKQVAAVSAFQQRLEIPRRTYGNDKSRGSTNDGSSSS